MTVAPRGAKGTLLGKFLKKRTRRKKSVRKGGLREQDKDPV